MYSYVCDDDLGMLVGLVTRGRQTDADYTNIMRAILAADRNAVARGIPFTYLMTVEQDADHPPVSWRVRFGALSNSLKASPLYFAFVSSNAVERGIFMAVAWLTNPRERRHMQAFTTFDDASKWLESLRGHACPELERLHERLSASVHHAEQQSAPSL